MKVGVLQNNKFLFLSSDGDVNKCSILFKIDGDKFNEDPVIGLDANFCNVTQMGGSVISSWRDKGVWNSNVYRVDSQGKWVLLLNDSCTNCQQVKMRYFKNGVVIRKILFSEGEGYISRKELSEYIKIPKAFLYKKPDEKIKTSAYLIDGDSFSLIDMSDDGVFYQIEYKSPSGNISQYWINSDDFEIKS